MRRDDALARTRKQPFSRGTWSIRFLFRTCATSTASSPIKSTPGRPVEHLRPFHPRAGGRARFAPGEDRWWSKLQQKNEVIAELMEENVRAKKANGEL
jgi:hypothetical protein